MDIWKRRFTLLAIIALIWIAIFGVSLVTTAKDNYSAGLPGMLFVSGALGAVLANYRRLSEIPESAIEKESTLRKTADLQIFLSPFVGGMFALLLWMLFYSGILSGSLFPKFTGTNCAYSGWQDLMAKTQPEKFSDAAKGVIWAFVAGYAERFVPNAIDRLARESEKENKGPHPLSSTQLSPGAPLRNRSTSRRTAIARIRKRSDNPGDRT
ncbi:hypothetical protein BVER_05010c [Candidatus Burkholderia verschuerenii]|uniref:Uncharacterized protein n=1 Tax=Candidatus Burkholderia verschuerenii TaxID=242163 RepID=A0A0L0MDC6_9BURK|nr:hypothetical protein [Candidatus Burkholderia verschuerenii]KND60270.1 hypothetical protein BVER_05010c [Candidatus Burkholderia verschuerenii]